MVSLWGAKSNDNGGDDAEHGERSGSGNGDSTANERTRLLPPPVVPQQEFLSPDDPAVSPYNLWSVRFMRYITVFFLVLTFLWWVLLLVSIFVSPPGMHSRGSGFFDFSYASLTLANLLIILFFFSTPSKAAQITCLITAVMLLVDMIMIVAVQGIRIEEGWVGIASVVGALVISIWMILTDRVVTYGKHEEEERLTGRIEPRRTLVEWLSVLTTEIVLIAISLVILLLTCTLILRARDSSLPAPGERYLVDGDKYRIHLYCSSPTHSGSGAKHPTVLFESGELPFEDTFQAFADNALANGTIARYCYADRPGLGWSDNAPSPFPAGMASTVLSEALARAGETGPWILASAGVGSIYSRIFSSQHGSAVRGLLLVDPLHEDLLYRLAAPHRGFALWLRGIMSPLGLERTFGAVFKGRTREDRVYGRSADLGGKFIKAKLQESLVADSLTHNEVRSARAIQREETPLVVVSSGIQMRVDSMWGQKQADLTHLTKKLVGWDVVEKAPHEVWRTVEGREVLEKRLGELVRL